MVAFKSTSFFASLINIYIFRCADLQTLGYYYCFVDRSTRINSPKCPYNKKIKLPLPYNYSENSVVSVAKLYMNTKYLNITWPSTKFRVFHFQDSYFFIFLFFYFLFYFIYLLFIYLFIF